MTNIQKLPIPKLIKLRPGLSFLHSYQTGIYQKEYSESKKSLVTVAKVKKAIRKELQKSLFQVKKEYLPGILYVLNNTEVLQLEYMKNSDVYEESFIRLMIQCNIHKIDCEIFKYIYCSESIYKPIMKVLKSP